MVVLFSSDHLIPSCHLQPSYPLLSMETDAPSGAEGTFDVHKPFTKAERIRQLAEIDSVVLPSIPLFYQLFTFIHALDTR